MRNKTRLISISELDFLVCFKNQLYGRNSSYLKCWERGETLVFVNGNYIVGVATVNGKGYTSNETIWTSSAYPHRVPISFTFAFVRDKRPSFVKHKRELMDFYGNDWGLCFGNKGPIPDEIAFSILQNVQGHNDCSKEIMVDLDLRLATELNKDTKKTLQRVVRESKVRRIVVEEPEEVEDSELEELVFELTKYCGMDPDQFVNDVREESFVRVLDERQRDIFDRIGWAEVRRATGDHMRKLGLFRPLWVHYGPGTYLVIGESHGEFTKQGMWNLIRRVSNELDVDQIFHIGHAVDNNGLINHELGKFDNLTVVTRIKEAIDVEEYAREFEEEPFGINRDGIFLGNLMVANQDFATEYMTPRTDSKTMTKGVFLKHVLFNHQYVEIGVADTDEDDPRSVRAYSGCICEPHVAREAPSVKYRPGSLSSRRILKRLAGWMSRIHSRKYHLSKEWTQGMFVVHVDESLQHTMVPCVVKHIFVGGKEEYATSYFDRIISETGVHVPDRKFFMNADIHAALHDPEVLAVQDAVVADYEPDVYVGLGDLMYNEGFNHHKMKKGEVVFQEALDEALQVHGLLRNMADWAPERYVLMGNHERFAHDFIKQFPQFKGLVEFEFLCSPESIGYTVVPLQKKLRFGRLVCLHGDATRGGTATILDKYAIVYPNNVVVIGHLHHPAIRRNVHMCGLSGKFDQEYNLVTISKWCHGFVLANEFNGEVWASTLAIIDNKICLNGRRYEPVDVEKWRTFPWKPEIKFVPVDQELSDGVES